MNARATRPSLLSSALSTIGLVLLIVGIFAVCAFTIFYPELKGPHKSLTHVVDLEGDGDLDVVVGRTRWEAVDISWAGIILWINQGDGQLDLLLDQERYSTVAGVGGGFAAGVGDVNDDGDPDLLIQNSAIPSLFVNQGGAQEGQSGAFKPNHHIAAPVRLDGYTDMGGSVTMGDLDGDGKLDAFIAGCCYGMDPRRSSTDFPYRNPSFSWVWIKAWDARGWLDGHAIGLSELDGLPIRGVALGDLDGDGYLDVFAAVGKPTLGTVDNVCAGLIVISASGLLPVWTGWV